MEHVMTVKYWGGGKCTIAASFIHMSKEVQSNFTEEMPH